MQIQVPERVRLLNTAIEAAGGRLLVVGGFVRDSVMGLPSKDIDLEVHGLSVYALIRILDPFGSVDAAGQSFGVLKLTFVDGEQFDIALPRRESKSGVGHKGFIVESDVDMSPAEAASRRDFTINAMMATADGTIIDPFNGLGDIRDHVLRATTERFKDDPLRVLRGMQFASRFGFHMDTATTKLSRELLPEFSTLSAERVWGEFSKWARGRHPALGLFLLEQTGWLTAFPVLSALVGVKQEPAWHPEGDVFEHTFRAVRAAADIAVVHALSPEDTETLVLATLLHDIGKPATTEVRDGRIISHGHAEHGAQLARSFLNGMRAPDVVADRIVRLVAEHMVHASGNPTPTAVRRLSLRLARSGTNVRMLALLASADASGRSLGFFDPMAEWVRVADSLKLTKSGPVALLNGRHLIGRGMQPGPAFGPILRSAFEAQLDGAFDTEADALAWLDKQP